MESGVNKLERLSQSRVAILLSTFNGESYLQDQLLSLKNQSCDFTLVWRDDGSSDGTKEIVRQFGFQNLIECSHSPVGQNIGPLASFNRATERALETEAHYFLYCDQDDVWQADKVATMVALADSQALAAPALWHHDLRVVDDDLKTIHPSFWAYMKLEVQSNELTDLLSRNSVTGAACMANRPLLQMAMPIPDDAVMHDWWLALITAACGTMTAVPQQLVYYRQHGANTIGAKGFWHGLNPLTNWIDGWKRGNTEYRSLFPQAEAAQHRCAANGIHDPVIADDFAVFLGIPSASWTGKLKALKRLGLRRKTPLLWLVAALRVLTTKVTPHDQPKI